MSGKEKHCCESNIPLLRFLKSMTLGCHINSPGYPVLYRFDYKLQSSFNMSYTEPTNLLKERITVYSEIKSHVILRVSPLSILCIPPFQLLTFPN